MRTVNIQNQTFKIRSHLGHLGGFPVEILIAVALIFPASAAQSKKSADPIVCIPDGTVVPGCIAETLPQPEADETMAEMGADMSEGANNIQNPGHANQFAFESDEPNASGDDVGANLNIDILCNAP